MAAHYQLNTPQVVSETIDDESIVINLATGTYYSLKGNAVDIWEGVIAGADLDELAHALSRHYDVSAEIVATSLGTFVRELEVEGLVRVSANGTGPVPERLASTLGDRRPFVEPRLEKHEDLQDIILLDPVHEAGDAGWPHPKAESSV